MVQPELRMDEVVLRKRERERVAMATRPPRLPPPPSSATSPSLSSSFPSSSSSCTRNEEQIKIYRIEPWSPYNVLSAVILIFLYCIMSSGNYVDCGSTSAASEDMATVNSVRREGVDSSLRKYALLAVSKQQQQAAKGPTVNVYNVTLTPLLRGIQSQALWLESGSSTLQQQGLSFNEISIPQGALISTLPAPDAPLLVIYRKIVNFTVYSLPDSFSFAGPVVGIIAYAAPPNFTTTSDDPALLAQLHISFSSPLITAALPLFHASAAVAASTSAAISCAFFALNGSVSFAATESSPNICASQTLDEDVALVLPAQDLNTSQVQRPPAVNIAGFNTPITYLDHHDKASSNASSWKLALGATCLALAGLGFCVACAVASIGLARRIKVVILARLTGNEEALQTSLIGVSRAPSAPSLRTKPALEMDMARFD